MSKPKKKTNNVEFTNILNKMASGELLLCGGSMFTDKENKELLHNAVANILKKP
jgi:hypothetical protein